jgi:putative NADH-flavin reductase
MRVLIFGGTGSVGRPVVDEALACGHEVTVFTRNPGSMPIAHDRLTVVGGDVMNPRDVAAALDGHDAVIQALGDGMPKGPTRIVSDATKVIVEQMRGGAVKRLVCVSNLGAGDSSEHIPWIARTVIIPLFLRWLTHLIDDKNRMEPVVTGSGLDWVIVRLPDRRDKPATGRIRDSEHGRVGMSMTFADAAHFVVARLTDNAYVGKTPAISN